MTSKPSSLAWDLSRIVLAGIVFDVSRLVAREIIFGALSSARFNDNSDNDKRQDDNVSTLANRWELNWNLIKSRSYEFVHDRRRVGLSLYLLLPPPLFVYGACDYLLFRKNKGDHLFQNSSLLGGIYVSSVATSLGLLVWVFPQLLSLDNNDEGVNEKKDSNPDSSLSKDKDSSGSLTKTTALRPPLHPNEDNDLERRPRSDSLRSAVSEHSVVTQTINIPAPEKSQKKYLEILVHNVSHTDLILGLSGAHELDSIGKRAVSAPFPAEFEDTPRSKNASPGNTADGDEKYIMCRPRFSAFDMFSRRVLSELQGQISSFSEEIRMSAHPLHQKIISYPRYERSSKTARYTLVTPRPSEQYMLPVGFNLERAEGINNTAVEPQEMPSLRIRGRDVPKVDPGLLGETPRRLTLPPQPLPTIHSPTSKQQEILETPVRSSLQEALRINAVFFPLLATLLPRWLGKIADKFGDEAEAKTLMAAPLHSPNVKKVVVLVSGVGTPRNWTHSISGNSTQACAELMELFIHVLYPDVTVVRIHSETNIFRYDENITFATQELMPCIDSYRDAHARCEPYPDEATEVVSGLERNPFNPDWRQSVSVTYSFADGSAARSHAIQAALRPYRPMYFHFWQLKTFWHESKITEEDIEVHSFEEMETEPAMAVDQTSDTVTMVVKEMKAFRKDFLETLKDNHRSDLRSFWLRKTKKPVLAVLLVQKPGGEYLLYRGTNMEVSMPTGSLCAERNVIGTALAQNPGLKREDLLMVAVLSVQMPKRHSPPPGPPFCSPAMSSLADKEDFANQVGDKLKQHQAQGGMRRVASASSFASIAEDVPQITDSPKESQNDWELDVFQQARSSAGMSPLASPLDALTQAQLVSHPDGTKSAASPPRAKEAAIPMPELNFARLSEASPTSNISGTSTPKRRITLYQRKRHSSGGGVKKQKQSLLLQSFEDMNPLKPCGACNEWLKKIAESNPHFKVITFTDNNCKGVYVSPCQD